MAQVHYVGKNGNRELDRERIEGLKIANSIARAKLSRIDGEVVPKREVAFMLEHMLFLLRGQILTIPLLVSSELRDLDNAQQHRVRTRVEDAIRQFLTQLADGMEAAMHGEEFIEKLEAKLNAKQDEDSMKLKETLAKKKRTAKRHEKAAR